MTIVVRLKLKYHRPEVGGFIATANGTEYRAPNYLITIDISLRRINHHTMIKIVLLSMLLTLATVLTVAQNPTGPQPKRARTPEDYKPGTLKDVAAKAASSNSRGNKEETMLVDADISPTRIKATYAGLTRRLTEPKAELIRQWARLYAGALETYKPYEVEVLFDENGSKYWLTFTQKTLTSFWDSRVWNKPVDLFVIRMGAVKTRESWEPVLLVENFQEAK